MWLGDEMRILKSRWLLISASLVLFFALLLFFSYPAILNAMAKSLVRQDTLQKTDAIVVLAGDSRGERMASGIELYKQGWGRQIIFWGGKKYWEIKWIDLMRDQFREEEVPEKDLLWSDEELSELSTFGEAKLLFSLMKENDIRSFILVTSPFHTSRAASVYGPMAERHGMKMYVHPSLDTRITLEDWWLEHDKARVIFIEFSKTVFYFIVFKIFG
jgi:uncharacterized SAM-binding protein YcdF (DUF218 family)